ncbi:MAG TPA: hypothetical protein VGN80_00065 [Devosiaceae bacterium]|jgi:hypothetical protein|nr:hypothetical protein [Devosiaceae bacterium]
MAERFSTVSADGIELVLDLVVGHIRSLRIEQSGRWLEPLHTAPWVEDADIVEDQSIDPGLRWLSGDFLCAPFAASDVEPAPGHGWPANSPWRLLDIERKGSAVTARYELERRVLGARITKELILRDGHPFLYERHVFAGGEGTLPVANHAMTSFGPGGGRLFFSSKRFGETLNTAIETDPTMGRVALAYPAHFDSPQEVPRAEGGTANITRYPFASRHEDFAMLVEAEGRELGWAAALRSDTSDMFLSLKHPVELPVTMLWFSNGGRDYRPWNGRHVGVLGVEEGRSYAAHGHRASIAGNPLSAAGIPTFLELSSDGEVSVRNVIGGLATEPGWEVVTALEASDRRLRVSGDRGTLEVPFDTDFLKGAPSWLP